MASPASAVVVALILTGCGGSAVPSAAAFCAYARQTGKLFAKAELDSPIGAVPGSVAQPRFAQLLRLAPGAIKADMAAVNGRVTSVLSGLSNSPDFGKASAARALPRIEAWAEQHCGQSMSSMLNPHA